MANGLRLYITTKEALDVDAWRGDNALEKLRQLAADGASGAKDVRFRMHLDSSTESSPFKPLSVLVGELDGTAANVGVGLYEGLYTHSRDYTGSTRSRKVLAGQFAAEVEGAVSGLARGTRYVGFVAFSGVPTAGRKISIGGVVLTFIAQGATRRNQYEVNLGANAIATVQSLVRVCASLSDFNGKYCFAGSGSQVLVVWLGNGPSPLHDVLAMDANNISVGPTRPEYGGSLTLSGLPTAGQSVRLLGATYAAVAGAPATNFQFTIGANATATMANLFAQVLKQPRFAAMAANVDPDWRLTSSGAQLQLVWRGQTLPPEGSIISTLSNATAVDVGFNVSESGVFAVVGDFGFVVDDTSAFGCSITGDAWVNQIGIQLGANSATCRKTIFSADTR